MLMEARFHDADLYFAYRSSINMLLKVPSEETILYSHIKQTKKHNLRKHHLILKVC